MKPPLSSRVASPLAWLIPLLVAAAFWLPGINWGLPSRQADRYLFGEHVVWDGATVLALAGDRTGEGDLAADVARVPKGVLPAATQPIHTATQRAADGIRPPPLDVSATQTIHHAAATQRATDGIRPPPLDVAATAPIHHSATTQRAAVGIRPPPLDVAATAPIHHSAATQRAADGIRPPPVDVSATAPIHHSAATQRAFDAARQRPDVLVAATLPIHHAADAGRAADGIRPPSVDAAATQMINPATDARHAADVSGQPQEASSSSAASAAASPRYNTTDAQRAAIVRRFRLYSRQPDEMITLMALARMRPGDLDPRLYQYGGLWVYGVGATIKLAGAVGWLQTGRSLAWYLDHPDAFGRFYIAARLYGALWGLLGVWLMYRLGRRVASQAGLAQPAAGWIAAAAAGLFAMMPVVINAAHEAKPHLAGAVLVLAAIELAGAYVSKPSRRRWLAVCIACGLAAGMVLSAQVAVAVLPVMLWLDRQNPPKRRWMRLFYGGAVALGVYCLSNPYVPLNALLHPAILRSNFSNTSAMYHAALGLSSVAMGLRWIVAGTGWTVLAAGLAGAVVVATQWQVRSNILCLAAGPVLLATIPYVLFAAGKPGEYGRFALLSDLGLLLCAVAFLSHVAWRRRTSSCVLLGIALLAATGYGGWAYTRGFMLDASATAHVWQAARVIKASLPSDAPLLLHRDPAPYCMPPADLFARPWNPWTPGAHGLSIAAAGTLGSSDPLDATPLSWANKPFELLASMRQ